MKNLKEIKWAKDLKVGDKIKRHNKETLITEINITEFAVEIKTGKRSSDLLTPFRQVPIFN